MSLLPFPILSEGVMSPRYTFYLGGGDIPWLYLKGVVMSLGYTY